jgi:hypothetical protein
MISLGKERANLAQANAHILEGYDCISRQQEIIFQLRAQDFDTAESEKLLDDMLQIMRVWLHHRDQILAAIESAPT